VWPFKLKVWAKLPVLRQMRAALISYLTHPLQTASARDNAHKALK
jgi:hypothetical protein